MTPKSLWTILVKILAIYLLWQCLLVIPQLLALFIANDPSRDLSSMATSIFFFFLILGFFILLIYQCIFSTDWIIEKLKLERGFTEERFELNIHRSTVLSISIIVIGGLMLVDGMPQTCIAILNYFQHADSYVGHLVSNYTIWLIADVLKVAIGYFMITESGLIVNFIERKRKMPVQPVEEDEQQA